MPTLVVFGAGNIGRSFVGQLFARAGYQVVFIEVNPALVEALNRQGRYRIEIKDHKPETIWVEGVSAIDGRDQEAVARAVTEADIIATAVGPGALAHIYPLMAAGLERRRTASCGPVDIIICENLRNAAKAFAEGLSQYLPTGFPLSEYIGLVETSIGKMVPIMPEAALREDPLVLYAEAYNTLILDARAFKNPIPTVTGLDPKQNMAAYVDRKAFIHNLGHAACAYLGYLANPNWRYVWQTMGDPAVRQAVKGVMWESGRALIRRYPGEFTEQNQEKHIEDLLSRFANQALGDTIFRVGRDLPRKLSREDRLVGALLMDAEEGVPAPGTILTTAAAFHFHAVGERGEPLPADAEFHRDLAENGVDAMLRDICGLKPSLPVEQFLARRIEQAHRWLQSQPDIWLERLLEKPGSVVDFL